MYRIIAIVLILWAILLPPLFTNGQCTEEFESFSSQIEQNSQLISTPERAQAFFESRSIPYAVVTPEECRRVKPRFLDRCGSGPLVYAEAPVKNRICRYYRDDSIKAQLHFDQHNRLVRFAIDMAPFKALPLPWGGQIEWGK